MGGCEGLGWVLGEGEDGRMGEGEDGRMGEWANGRMGEGAGSGHGGAGRAVGFLTGAVRMAAA
jgi:hypothetical protein